MFALDPLTTTAADVEDLHDDAKRVVCLIAPIHPSDPDALRSPPDAYHDRLKLCRDKGFDAVTFVAPDSSLARQAADIGLPVVQR